MIQGTSISVTYALVLFALAFRQGFARKDVVSLGQRRITHRSRRPVPV
ncbi:hypothetical protein SVIOM74S_10506 [Streptomyces violarus]